MVGPTTPRPRRMQRPTDILRAEHALVEGALRSLLAIARHVRADGALPSTDLAVLLRFLRGFVLGVHLRKDAEVVWPAVAMRGDERTALVVGDLCRLLEEVTDLVHSLVLFWEPVDDLTKAERQGFADMTSELATRLRRMQSIEEHDLLPACSAAAPDDQLEWSQRFAELERGLDDLATWKGRLASVAAAWST